MIHDYHVIATLPSLLRNKYKIPLYFERKFSSFSGIIDPRNPYDLLRSIKHTKQPEFEVLLQKSVLEP